MGRSRTKEKEKKAEWRSFYKFREIYNYLAIAVCESLSKINSINSDFELSIKI